MKLSACVSSACFEEVRKRRGIFVLNETSACGWKNVKPVCL
jgi:hypothetical protein